MLDFYILIALFLLGWFFVFQRNVAEAAKVAIQKYCDQEKLQFISIARESTRLTFNKRQGVCWVNTFAFEFSGDGESAYTGKAEFKNLKFTGVDIPAYRI